MTDRERLYATKLSKMIQCETISEPEVENAEKFGRFHELLKELFPNVFSKCEVVYIGQSLLIKLKRKESPNDNVSLLG